MTDQRKREKKLFLSDDPIIELKEDEFGHKEFVNTLYESVKNCDLGINIGLFGRWGVGKTSIINLLFKRFERKDQKIKCFFFDAWKYPSDSLRQELILEINKKYKVYDEKELEDDIYNIQEEEKIPRKRGLISTLVCIWKRFKPSIILTIVLLALLLLLHFFDVISIYSSILLFLLPALVQLIIEINSAARSVSKRMILPRKFDPERLGTKFGEIVNEMTEKNKADKIVIAIDNLDRCSSESTIKMLEAIKTFMGHNNCIYIIPCDDNALIKHLRFARGYDEKDAREFLRKFFQTSFTIPHFLNQDLEKFASNKLSELDIPYSEDVLQVIVNAYIDNPRRIKQFLNNLTTQYLAAKEREKVGIIKDGEITNKDGFLAKMLVIREEWPSFYEKLESDENLLGDIESYFRGKGEVPKYSEKNVFDDNPKLDQFLRSTRTITVEDISPFLNLNKESFPSTISNFEEFKLQFNRGDIDYISKTLDKLKAKEKIEHIEEMLNILDREIQAQRFDWGFNGIDILIKIYDQIPDKVKNKVVKRVGIHMTAREIADHLNKFDYEKTFQILRNMKKSHRNDILEKYSEVLVKKGIDQELIDRFIEYYDIIPRTAINSLNKAIATTYVDNEEKGREIIRNITHNPEAKERLISDDVITAIINSVDNSVSDENKKRVDLYLEIKGISTSQNKSLFLQKILDIISTNRNNNYDAEKSFGVETLLKLDSEDLPKSKVGNLYKILNEFTNLMGKHNHKLQFFKVFFKFFKSFSDQQREEFLRDQIVRLIPPGGANTIKNILEEAEKAGAEILKYDFVLDATINKIKKDITDKNAINLVIVNSPKDKKPKTKDMLINFIKNNNRDYYVAGLNSFKECQDKIPDEYIDEICNTCLERSKQVPPNEKKLFLDPVVEAFRKSSQKFKNRFADHVLEFVRDNNMEIRNMGVHYFKKIEESVKEDKKKTIIIQLISGIRNRQNNVNDNDKPILDLIVEKQEILDREDMINLIDILMGLINETNSKQVRLIGLEYLGRISKFYHRKSQVLTEIKNASSSEDEDIQQIAKQILDLWSRGTK